MYVRVRATPGAKKEIVLKSGEDEFSISVKEKAGRNMANQRIIFLVAKWLGVSSSMVRIVNGHRSRTKLLKIEKKKL